MGGSRGQLAWWMRADGDLIFTSKGLLPVDSLTYSEGGIDNENEHTTWQEWRDGSGEIVKRAVADQARR